MQFYMPVKVFEEVNAVRNHREEIEKLGKKAMIVIGSSSAKKNGSLSDVTEVLESSNISYVIFDSVEANPSVETVMKARTIGVEEGVDFLIGIGGGSPMDAAKAVALLLAHPDATEDYLFDGSKDSTALPCIMIPTTCGTGSEVTGVSVLTRHALKTKQSVAHKIFAKYAFVDGRYLKTAPLSVLRNTAIDAISHLWESAISVNTTPYSRMLSDAGLREWAKNKDSLMEGDFSEGDYQSLLRASTMAGMAIAHGGTCLPHGFSYPVTYDTGMEHGKACGYFQAGYLLAADRNLRADLLNLAGLSTIEEWMKYYLSVCDVTPLSDEVLNRSVDVLYANKSKIAQAPFAVTEESLREMAYSMRSVGV